MRTRFSGASLVLITLLLFTGTTFAAGSYPSPLPDFAHRDAPHLSESSFLPTLSYDTGRPAGFRPLLVIYARFAELPGAPDEADVRSIAFDLHEFGTLANYFSKVSGFNFTLAPATETCGAENDGFAAVTIPLMSDFLAKTEVERNDILLDMVEDCVNFAHFDEFVIGNKDGRVTGDELAILVVYQAQNADDNCGKTRAASPKKRDGKDMRLSVADGTTETNLITHAHELGHQTLGLVDLYIIGTGQLALGGPTCNSDKTSYFHPNAWERVHWGWKTPRVITKDGYYTIFSDLIGNPDVDILYDHDKGADHYFMVEYRRREAGSYDQSASDRGLVIWRVWDSKWPLSNTEPRFVDLMRPDGTMTPACDENGFCYGGMNTDAWDPTDVNTPQRTMSRAWTDGSPSNVAVRAIGQPEQNSMTVYYDVRGPGVLVDATASGGLRQFTTPLAGTTTVSFAVMNTGEATDTFDFTVVNLPNGITATTHTMTLAAGQQSTANVTLTVPEDLETGIRSATARGRSTTDSGVSTESRFNINITRQQVAISYSGMTTADYSDPATMTATLTNAATGAPLANRTVSFQIGSQTTTALTNASGVATAQIVIDQPAASVTLRASFAGDASYLPRTFQGTFVIDKEDLTWTYTGDTLLSNVAMLGLSAQATQASDGSSGDLARAAATFTLTPTLTQDSLSLSAEADSNGVAHATPTDVPADLWTVTVSVPEDNQYWKGSTASPTEVVIYDPNGVLGGSAQGLDSDGTRTTTSANGSYANDVLSGQAKIEWQRHRFTSGAHQWLVVVGEQAILQTVGRLGTANVVVRLEITDGGSPGIGADTYRVVVTDSSGIHVYDSSTVTIDRGNMEVRIH